MSTAGLVTILFTDLVGSTALSQELGDEAADDVRREHFEVLRQAVSRSGGTEVKTIGDALMVSYPAAADAIAGAVAMQQGVARHNRRSAGPRLEMRIGISAGDATFEDGDWFGTPVVEASRLSAAAEGEQILVTDIVRVLAGSRVDCALEPVPPVEAKGLTEPLAACRVLWSPEDDDVAESRAVPLPPVFDQPDVVALVGRDAERSTVVDAWKEVVAGDRRVVLIAGEPGIGKTRLVKEVCRLAHTHGGTVLWGGCEEELGIPYQPFVEAIRWYAGVAPLDDLRAELGPLGGELVRMVPELERLVPGLDAPVTADAETERYRLFEAVVDMFATLSGRAPLLLVLDDVHWAAKPTLLLLRHLLRASAALRVLVVATYRDTDLDRTHPLAEMLADLRRAPGVERLALAGLDDQGVADFLEYTAGHALEDDGLELARVIRAETEGNPFFVGEVLRHLVETGALVHRDGRWTSDLTIDEVGIPEGVREVIGRRLSHLDPATNEVLTLGSVVGREFDVGVLAALVPDGQDEALDALEAAEASGLVRAVPGRAASYRFSHTLVRSTLYDELTTSRRLRLHRDVGRVLADRPDADTRLPELARHFSEAAALGEVDRAIDFCRRAGDAARDELAFEEAASYYERALNALDLADDPSPATRADLLLASGRTLVAIADPRGREVLISAATAARVSGDAFRFADAALALQELTARGGFTDIDTELIAVLEEAVERVGDQDLGRRAKLLSSLATTLIWTADVARRRALLDESLGLARAVADPEVLAPVLMRQIFGYDHTDAASIERATADLAELVGMAEAISDPTIVLSGQIGQLHNAVLLGDRARADAALAAIETLAERLRQPALHLHARILRAAHLLLSGRLDDAEREIHDLEAFQQQHELPANGPTTLMFRLYYERGRLDEIEELIESLVENQPAVATWRVALIGVYTNTDQLDAARTHIEALAADDFAMVPRNQLWVVTIAGVARTAATVGMLDIAERALELMVPFGHTIAITGMSYEQPVGMSTGVAAAALGRWDEAERFFAQALDVSERAGAPTFVAVTQVNWAQALMDRGRAGDAERARGLATSALATARELGLGRVEELSHRVLD